MVTSIEGFHLHNFIFSKWVQVVAKKHEHRLLKEYVMAINDATGKEIIKEEFFKQLHCYQ